MESTAATGGRRRDRTLGRIGIPTSTAAEQQAQPSVARAVLAVSLALAAVTSPVFLAGALSTRMRDDFGGTGASVAVTAFFVGAGLLSVPMGWVADRIGARQALRAGVLVSGLADLAIAGWADRWWHVTVVLFLAGTAVGLVDTGGARAFSEGVPDRRHGLAFGIKEASIPAATLLAGLSIPLLAQQLGWRAAFVAAVTFTPAVWTLAPRDRSRDGVDGARARRAVRRGPLTLFATGIALGTGAATAAATLFVPAFDARGWSENAAGVLLAVASAASITTRLATGWTSDRRPTASWWAISVLMTVGASGAGLLAVTGEGTAAIPAVVGAVLVIGAGWGWTGLAFQTAVRVSPGAPALAAGIVLAGLSVGGAAGPAAFGALGTNVSYDAAWTAATVAFLAGAAAVVAARVWIERPVGSQ